MTCSPARRSPGRGRGGAAPAGRARRSARSGRPARRSGARAAPGCGGRGCARDRPAAACSSGSRSRRRSGAGSVMQRRRTRRTRARAPAPAGSRPRRPPCTSAMIASFGVRSSGLSSRQPRRPCRAIVLAACWCSSASSGSCSRRSDDRGVQPRRRRDHARVGLRERDAQRCPRAPARRRAARPATGRTRSRGPLKRCASSRITSPASSTASSPWPIHTPTRRSSVTHATAVAERWPPTSTPTHDRLAVLDRRRRRRTPASAPGGSQCCARSVHWFATNRRNARSGRPALRVRDRLRRDPRAPGSPRFTVARRRDVGVVGRRPLQQPQPGTAGVGHGAAARHLRQRERPGAQPAERAVGALAGRRDGHELRARRACGAPTPSRRRRRRSRAPAARRRSPASRSGRAACGRRRPTPPASASRPSRCAGSGHQRSTR